MADDKGLKPSKRKLEKARREGRVNKSSLLSQSFPMVIVTVFALYTLPSYWVRNRMLLEYTWSIGFLDPLASAAVMGRILLEMVFACISSIVVAAVLMEVAQVGFQVQVNLVSLRFERLNLASGLKRIAGGIGESWQVALRLILASLLLLWFFNDSIDGAQASLSADPAVSLGFGFHSISRVVFSFGALLLTLAALNYWLKSRHYFRDLSMSHQEMRREIKDDSGDPILRAVRNSLYHSLSLSEIVARTRRTRVLIVEKEARSHKLQNTKQK